MTPDDLLAAKAAGDTRISLVIPAYDEAATVGDVVGRVRAELVERVPLLDELVVIDSESDDDTAAVAAAAGATVYRLRDVLPNLKPVRGKGEAIWRSQFVTTGDVVAFLDADLVEWGPHFVTDVVAPLLLQPSVQLVKGWYDRVLDTSLEGGRATELVARPLLARRWPDLGAVVQPLAGEWAIRRSLLETLSVPVGYGVDLAVLIDTYTRFGLDAIAQADLGRRAHSHQSLADLGAMALQLLAVTDRRAGIAVPHEELAIVQYRSTGVARALPVHRKVPVLERPPAVHVVGYPGLRGA